MTQKIVLADLEAPLPPVELPGGREIPVKPIDAVCAQLHEEYEEKPTTAGLLRIIRHVLPDATDDEIGTLTPAMMAAVVQIATGKAATVVEYIEERARAKAGDDSEGNPTAPPGGKPRGRRRRTGSAS